MAAQQHGRVKMSSGLKQLRVLLVKNFRKKNIAFLYTSCEIVGPLIYAAMVYNLLGIRDKEQREPPTSIDFDKYSIYNHSYILGYAPANDITDELMFRAARLVNQKYKTDLEAIGFDSEYQMMRFVRKHPQGIHSVYAFDNMTSRTKQLPETLHLILRPIINSEERNEIPQEYTYDLHTMQAIMESYIYQQTGREHKLNVTWSNKSTFKNVHQSKLELIQTVSLLCFLLLGFLICRNVYCVAHERESGVLKLLIKTGVNMYIYWLSWFITVFVIIWLASLVIGAMMFVEHTKTSPAFIKSSIYAVLLYFTLFAVACTLYCIMGSVICQKANTACIISTCFFLGSAFPLQIVKSKAVSVFFACFLINKNVHLTLVNIDQSESKGRGFTFSSTQTFISYISVSFCGLVYVVMTIILYNCVINHRPLWMILQQWKYKKLPRSFRDSYQTMAMSEDSLSHLKSAVIIDKLCANIPAPLGEINFTIYQGLVTVITDLDGNSSTTFLSILTGENQPLKGSVLVGNLDIVKNIAEIKRQIGLCPKEQTALYDSFTVLENLEFFYEIKSACQGYHDKSRLQEVIDMFELNKNLRASVHSLSPAEKRLLQVAIVYLGKSKLLLFDCPTLDMDPYTKSKSWNVIRTNIEETIVIVCTESIEEAEMVGDMIAVVSGGLMRSYGTIEYIYCMYGIGYKLVIEKEAKFDNDRVMMLVTEMISNVRIVDHTATRLVLLLPMHAAAVFYHLLTFLENYKQTLGIARFSVNTVSLEEAILEKSTEVALLELNEKQSTEFTITTPKKYEMLFTTLRDSYAESNVDKQEAESSTTDPIKEPIKTDVQTDLAEEVQVMRYTGCRLMFSQIEALFKKKIILSVCSFHLEVVQVIFLVTLASWLYSEPIDLDTKETSKNPRALHDVIVGVISMDSNNTVSSQLAQRYEDFFQHSDSNHVKALTSYALPNDTSMDELQTSNMIGAIFHVDNISNVYEGVAVHSTRDNTSAADLFLPESITAIMNVFLRHFTQSNRYYMYASQLPEGHSVKDLKHAEKTIMRTVRIYRHHSSFMQAVAFLMVPYFAVSERTTGFKHLQHLSGASSVMYWAVSLVCDLTTYLFLGLLYPVIAAFFETRDTIEFVESIELMMVVSGVVMLLYIYVLQFAFSVPASAAFIICLTNYFSADAETIVQVLFGKQGQSTDNFLQEWIVLVLPPCIFPYYIYTTAEKNRYYKLCQSNSAYCDVIDQNIADHCCRWTCIDPQCTNKQSTLADKNIGIGSEIVVAVAVHLVFWTMMLLLIEYRTIHNIKTPRKSTTRRKTFNIHSLFNRRKSIYRVPSQLITIDPGITEELQKLQDTTDDVGLIRIVGVDNIDPYIPGLTRLNLLINSGESYCFVDTDKSRASDILRILSGMKEPQAGNIIVKGKPFKIGGKPSFTPIGYCTDMDAVLGALTGREVLTIHAKLRGITDQNLSNVVDSTLKKFNLLDKADSHSGNYNSSDKRLLNIAVAIIGDPEIILLDDPFGNLDVVNKSLVWQALDKSMVAGSAVIMGSDKIREVSDKVTVVAILLDGEPVCIGSPEIVRNRYCSSYTLLAKLDVCNRNLPIESLITTLQERFPKSVIFYDHQDFLHMRIPYDDTTLPDVFALMESAKKHLKMHSYKLVHTNLSYVITAIQQRIVEDSTIVNECEDGDTEG